MRILRNVALDLVLAVLRTTLRLLSRVVPQSRSVVLAVFPETEGNGVEVARSLIGRYTGRLVWLRDGGPVPAEVRELANHGMVLVPKASLTGLWAYLRAEAVLFTHGLYGSPRPVERKPVVNLFHGDGPKDVAPAPGVGEPMASTYLVGSTSLFSGFQADAFGVPRERVLLTGNPRTDQLWHDVPSDRLAALGIHHPYVVWLPTFRQPRAVGAVRVHDAAVVRDDASAELAALRSGLAERGITLVVKPHPMDADRRRGPGVVTLDDADLARVGVGLYPLLGGSAGLVTDYSSVWVDYLLVDRPIAFLVPDLDTYDRRLLPADVLDWAPGEVIGGARSARPFEEFLADLDALGRQGSARRLAAAQRMGLNPTTTAADDLVTELVKRGVLGSG